MRYTYLVLLLIVCYAANVAAEIYRWKDDAGNIVFSDTPKPGAEIVELSEPTIVPGGAPRPTEKRRPVAKARPYKSIAITSPADQATIRDNVANINVSISVEPRLQTRFGHKLNLVFDGQSVGEPSSRTNFTLPNVDRGAHNLRAVIIDDSGKTVTSSSTVTIFVHKQTVNSPAR